jgi:hypothetical protein
VKDIGLELEHRSGLRRNAGPVDNEDKILMTSQSEYNTHFDFQNKKNLSKTTFIELDSQRRILRKETGYARLVPKLLHTCIMTVQQSSPEVYLTIHSVKKYS